MTRSVRSRCRCVGTGRGGFASFFLKHLLSVLVLLAVGCGIYTVGHYVVTETGHKIGAAAWFHILPLFAIYEPHFSSRIVYPILIIALYLLIMSKYVFARRISVKWFLLICCFFMIAMSVSVAWIDGEKVDCFGRTVPAFLAPFDGSANVSYWFDVPRIRDEWGVRHFLLNYAERDVFEAMSEKSRGHPPGAALIFYYLASVLQWDFRWVTLAMLAVSSLTIVPVWFLSKEVLGRRKARYATALFPLIPNICLFTSGGVDGVFLLGITSAITFLVLMLYRRQKRFAVLFGVATAFSSCGTFSSFFIFIFAGFIYLHAGVFRQTKLERYRSIQLIAISIASFFVVIGSLFLCYRYPPLLAWKAIRTVMWNHDYVYGTGYDALLKYLTLTLLSSSAFLFGSGVSFTAWWLKSVPGYLKCMRKGLFRADIYFCFLISFLFMVFSVMFSIETERVWIFMVPIMLLPVIDSITSLPRAKVRYAMFYVTAALLAIQTIVIETLLFTYD